MNLTLKLGENSREENPSLWIPELGLEAGNSSCKITHYVQPPRWKIKTDWNSLRKNALPPSPDMKSVHFQHLINFLVLVSISPSIAWGRYFSCSLRGRCPQTTARRVGCELAPECGHGPSSLCSGLGVGNIPFYNQDDAIGNQILNSSTDFKSHWRHRNSLAVSLPVRHSQPEGAWTMKQGLSHYIAQFSARGQEQEHLCHDCLKFISSFCWFLAFSAPGSWTCLHAC